ncbi:MAG: hypothetical protein K2Y37_01440 [Pirellulales bacterium]|nr:hypothetical protein [Pirellulales bacterium]
MTTVTPTLIVCEQTDRWRLGWQTWQARRAPSKSPPSKASRRTVTLLRSLRRLAELPATIDRFRPAGVLLEVTSDNRVSTCEQLARLRATWPARALFVAGSRAERGVEAAARWAGATACAWSVRELQPLVDWFENYCLELESPTRSWEQQILDALPWGGASRLLQAEE